MEIIVVGGIVAHATWTARKDISISSFAFGAGLFLALFAFGILSMIIPLMELT